jgi:hypothetical protein
MSKQLTRNHRLILIIMAMSFIPFTIAWVMTKNPQWFSSRTNNGELIIPPVTTTREELMGFDQFSRNNLAELKGRWVIVNIIPGDACDAVCQESIYKTRQLRLMMGKDLTRIRRVVLLFQQIPSIENYDWWKQDDRLLRAVPANSLIEKLKHIYKGEIRDGVILLMDPFGNLMMYYQPGFDAYDIKADLKKLLRISQIG